MILEKKELKYILWSLAIAFVWMVLIIPNLDSIGMGSSPVLRFLIFNVGIFVLLQVVLKGVVTNSSIKLVETLGLLMIANAIDLLAPPFVWNTLGQANTSILLSEASSDYIIGILWQAAGINGFLLYVFTYVLSPILLLVIAGFLIKNFVRKI